MRLKLLKGALGTAARQCVGDLEDLLDARRVGGEDGQRAPGAPPFPFWHRRCLLHIASAVYAANDPCLIGRVDERGTTGSDRTPVIEVRARAEHAAQTRNPAAAAPASSSPDNAPANENRGNTGIGDGIVNAKGIIVVNLRLQVRHKVCQERSVAGTTRPPPITLANAQSQLQGTSIA